MIRQAIEDDLDDIADMCQEFWTHTMYEEEFDFLTIYEQLYKCMGQELLAVAEKDNKLIGFVAGIEFHLLANKNVKMGVELAWWVKPECRGGSAGIKLLQYIEELAKKRGIKYWNMAYMESSMPEVIKSLYERLGYQKTESTYCKRL